MAAAGSRTDPEDDRVEVTAPCRADLAGGTIDIWPLGVLHAGAVTVNLALSTGVRLEVATGAAPGCVTWQLGDGARVVLEPSDAASDLTAAVAFELCPDGGVEVVVRDEAPRGSGLGGSSTYGVALASGLLAVTHRRRGHGELVALVRDLEARLLNTPTGTQDHWAAVRGGCLAIHHRPGGEQVESLGVDRTWLEGRLSVVFTGIAHASGMVNWQVVRRRLDGDPLATRAFDELARAGELCRTALLEADAAGVAGAIRRDWDARRGVAPEVCPDDLETLVQTALDAGATAVKGAGAGGGGSLLLWHPPEHGEKVRRAVLDACPDGARALEVGTGAPGCSVRRAELEDA